MLGIENGNFWEEDNSEKLFEKKEQKNTNDSMAFLGEKESIPIINIHQEILDNENIKTEELSDKNRSNTKENVNKWFKGTVLVSYSKVRRSDREKIVKTNVPTIKSDHLYNDDNGNDIKDDGEEYIETTGDYRNFDNYHTTAEIKNERNNVLFLEQQNRNLEGSRQDIRDKYWDFWGDLTRQANNGEITWDEVYERDREFWDYENGGIIEENEINEELSENSDSITNSEEVIKNNEERELTKYSRDILDSFKEAQNKGLNVTYVLKNKYSNASEDEKIKLLQTVGDKMLDNYNKELSGENGGKSGDVSSDQMWNSMIDEELLGGVCRHIHSEVSILAEGLGMTSGMISTNSGGDGGGAHAISLLKKEDGTFAIIDYGNIYEGRNFEELQSSYLDQKGSSLLQQMITGPNGNPLRFFQRHGSKLFGKNLSALGTLDTFKKSKEVAKEGLVIQEGFDISVNTGSSTDISTTYGNGAIEVGASYNNDNSGLYKNYESYSVHTKAKLGDRKGIGEFGALLKISEHNFDYYSGKLNSYNGLSVAGTYSKELVNNDEMKVDLGFAGQINLNGKKGNLSDGPSSGEASIGGTVVGEYYLDDSLTLKGNLGVGGEGGGNMRSEDLDTLRLYGKHSSGLGIDYKGDGYIAGVDGYYEKGLGYNEVGGDGYIKGENIKVTAGYSKNSDTTKFDIGDVRNKIIGIEYDITDTLNIKSNYSESDSYGSESDNFYVGGEWKF